MTTNTNQKAFLKHYGFIKMTFYGAYRANIEKKKTNRKLFASEIMEVFHHASILTVTQMIASMFFDQQTYVCI